MSCVGPCALDKGPGVVSVCVSMSVMCWAMCSGQGPWCCVCVSMSCVGPCALDKGPGVVSVCVCLCLSCVGPCALDKGPGASTRALVPHSYNGSGVSTAAKLARPVFTHGFFSAWCC